MENRPFVRLVITPNSRISTNSLGLAYGCFIGAIDEQYPGIRRELEDTWNEFNIILLDGFVFRPSSIYTQLESEQTLRWYINILAVAIHWKKNSGNVEINKTIIETILNPERFDRFVNYCPWLQESLITAYSVLVRSTYVSTEEC